VSPGFKARKLIVGRRRESEGRKEGGEGGMEGGCKLRFFFVTHFLLPSPPFLPPSDNGLWSFGFVQWWQRWRRRRGRRRNRRKWCFCYSWRRRGRRWGRRDRFCLLAAHYLWVTQLCGTGGPG